jgi:diacylglycerol O-acyltransferase / wax synthase
MAATEMEPSAWGAERELNAVEALMWRAEADPRMRNAVTSLEILDCEPDWDRLWAAHDWGSRLVPRFRKRVVEPPLGVGAPVWAVDPDWDLDRHLRRAQLPAPGTMRQLLDLAQEIASAPFDRAHPPWEAVLIEGLEGDRAAYVLKVHHSITDGLGGIQLLSMLHSRQREPTPDKPQPPPPPPEPTGGGDVLVEQLAKGARGLPGDAARAALGAARGAGRALLRPDRTAAEALEYARSLARVAGPPAAAPSPLLASRSLRWRFEVLDVPLDDLRAAAKAVGASVNDAFVTALLGAFARYHDAFGVPIRRMPIAIPVSLRSAEHPMGGNRFAGVRLAAPVGERDPRRRIERVRDLVLTARHEPAFDALGVLAPALGRLPAPLIARVAGQLTAGNDLQASNVPGIPHPVYMAGARITHLYPFGPLPGCAAMIALVSHCGTCCIGANLDAAAFTDPELFARCMAEGFAEVLDLRAGSPDVEEELT